MFKMNFAMYIFTRKEKKKNRLNISPHGEKESELLLIL